MADFDVFNGDADGLCALHQLRLADARPGAELVTGVKRDIGLLPRIAGRVGAGDRLVVLDVAIEPNVRALEAILSAGASVQWFDHHHPGEIPPHEGLQANIDQSPEVCTSLLVDRHLGGRFRAWAIVALFGDGLSGVARRLSAESGIDAPTAGEFERLGEAMNYNAYGETVNDLLLPPAELYRRIAPYENPLDFIWRDAVAGELSARLSSDLGHALATEPSVRTEHCIALLLPDAPWARRISGHYANILSEAHPGQAIALLTPLASGACQVSVRAPKRSPVGADALCRRFPTGGGRSSAAGINHLAPGAIGEFLSVFERQFSSDTKGNR